MRSHRTHPSSLTSEQLEMILRDIQDYAPRFAYPVSGPKISIEDLIRITISTIFCKKGTPKIILDIPLLDRLDYNTHQIHPVPIVEFILKSGSERAYVRPEFLYNATMEFQRLTLPRKLTNICGIRTCIM